MSQDSADGRPGSPQAMAAGRGSFGLRFEVLAPIAMGSTARVDLCRSLGPRQSGALIAVKRLLPDLVNDAQIGKRFLDEVWMTAALHDPNVVGVVGWGQDNRGPYLAVELVQGVSLARLTKSVVDTGEQFPERLVVYIGLCVARGLGAAHELRSERGELLNLVHRDLSAANVLVGFQGEVKIADFGLAKAKDRLTVTTSELPSRTMSHVAPEELQQQPVDHRSDLWGFGVMLFQLLTGTLPFTGKDELAVLEAVLHKEAPDLLSLRPKMDKSLAAIVQSCLEKNPASRPQSAREIGRSLEQWLYAHGYLKDSQESLARFVRRNSMRQMRWFESVTTGNAPTAPVPFHPTQPSLYPLHEQAALTASIRATRTANLTARHNEPTVVGGRNRIVQASEPETPQYLGPPLPEGSPRGGRSRSSDAIPAARVRRRDSVSAGLRAPATPAGRPAVGDGAPSMIDEEEQEEDAPTIALKVDSQMREDIKQYAARRGHAAADPSARPPLETVRMEDPETSQDHTLGDQIAAHEEQRARERDQEPALEGEAPTRQRQALSSPHALAQHIDAELRRLRQLAGQRHEQARVARETAHKAALAADVAESGARAVERALAGVRQAMELASRGDPGGAIRRLEEALTHAGLAAPTRSEGG